MTLRYNTPECIRPDCDVFADSSTGVESLIVEKILGRAHAMSLGMNEEKFFWLIKWQG